MSWQTSVICSGSPPWILQKTRELLDRLLIAPLGHEHRPPLARIQIAEHRHVVLTATKARVVDPQLLDPGEILRLDRLIDVVVHDPPDLRLSCSPTSPAIALTGISFASAITNASNSSVKSERSRAHGTCTCLTPCSATDRPAAPARSGTPRARKKFRCRHVCGSVSCTLHPAAPHSGHGKRAPFAEVDPQIEPPPLSIELDVDHLPRLLKTKRALKQVQHRACPSSHHRAIRSPADLPPDRTLPTQNSEEPKNARCRRSA